MDKCPICGHVENPAQPVNSHVMNRFVRQSDGHVVVMNSGEKTITTFKPGPVDAKTGEPGKIKVEWVREDIHLANQAAKPAAPAEVPKVSTGGLVLS